MFIELGLYEVFIIDTQQAKELFYGRAVATSSDNAIAQVSNKIISSKPINFHHLRFFSRCIGTWTDTSPLQFTAPAVIKKGPPKEDQDEST